MHNISPSLLASVGVLCMSQDDVGWRLMLAGWVEQRQSPDKTLLRTLCEIYVEEIVQYLKDLTKLPTQAKPNETGPFYSRVVPYQSEENMIHTLIALLEVNSLNFDLRCFFVRVHLSTNLVFL